MSQTQYKFKTDLIEYITSTLGIAPSFYISKVENDDITKVLIDNLDLFYNNDIYAKFINWFYMLFKPAFDYQPLAFTKCQTDRDNYLRQIIYLIVPELHVKFFFNKLQDVTTPKEVIELLFTEINYSNSDVLGKIRSKSFEIDLVM